MMDLEKFVRKYLRTGQVPFDFDPDRLAMLRQEACIEELLSYLGTKEMVLVGSRKEVFGDPRYAPGYAAHDSAAVALIEAIVSTEGLEHDDGPDYELTDSGFVVRVSGRNDKTIAPGFVYLLRKDQFKQDDEAPGLWFSKEEASVLIKVPVVPADLKYPVYDESSGKQIHP